MFEQELSTKLQQIFEMKKATFSSPSPDDVKEQECLFIAVDKANVRIKDARAHAKVEGKCAIYANSDKLPFGYIAKCIAAHSPGETANFFFSDIEENVRGFQNIVQRSFSFVYFFDSQYDPRIGTLSSITIEVETP